MLSGLGLGGFPGRVAPRLRAAPLIGRSVQATPIPWWRTASYLQDPPPQRAQWPPRFGLPWDPGRSAAQLPRGVVAPLTAGKSAALCVPSCQKAKHQLKRNLKVIGKSTNLLQKAKHYRSGLNEQVWQIIRLEARHEVGMELAGTQYMLDGLDCFPSRLERRK